MEEIRVEKMALAGLALVVAVLMSSSVQAIPTTCLDPGAVSAAWQAKVPVAQCVATDEAEKVCKAWLKTCKRVVSDAGKCRNGELASGATLEKARCKLSTIVDPTQCKSDAIDHASNLKAQVKVQKTNALDACEAYVPTCILNCLL